MEGVVIFFYSGVIYDVDEMAEPDVSAMFNSFLTPSNPAEFSPFPSVISRYQPGAGMPMAVPGGRSMAWPGNVQE